MQTVTQTPEALMWQDDGQVSEHKMSYKSALSYCESLGLNDMNDWRMPTQQELFRLVDTQRTPTIFPVFAHTATECYWNISKDQNNRIGSIDFSTGKSLNTVGIDHTCFIRCVRKIK
ncbi:DUF1566 domain-containing protein [Sulfuricurvum sp.]|nr:DUF1566 domain-containing protein [Sulfuricurvum sp.]MDD4948739.1 DUF1566 domain-containing protein [Sulfuricurvum sp.]